MIAAIVRHAPTVLVATIAIFVFGLLSYVSLPREAAPDVKIPVVMVTTPYIGVSPADIESLVTIPIENELAGIRDLKKMSSTSAEGASIISLEFEPDVVIEDALQRTRDRVNRARSKIPDDAEEPSVREISFSDVPILLVTIAGPADEESLKHLGERLEDEVKRIPGVLDATLTGGREREIRVEVDPRRLAAYGLALTDVQSAIGNENVNIPGGEVKTGDVTFLLRVPGEFTEASQIEGVAIKRKGDRPVFIRDVARVVDGQAKRSSYARMNGQTAVSLAVTKRVGANIVDIADQVKQVVASQSATWPTGVKARVLADQSKFIRDTVRDLENNIITALILVVGVLLFFMGARSSLFVAISIPLSMLISFAVLDTLGITLNMVVLFALILALGMLVDNAIVVVENVYRHMEEGLGIVEAAITGTKEVAIAVTASTATTVAAFLPLLWWTGIMGQFMGFMPKTVIIVLTASLVAAVGILPVFLSIGLKPSDSAGSQDARYDGPLFTRYRQVLEWSIRNRYLSLGAGVLSLFVTFGIYGVFNHGTEFFPDSEPDRATIAVRLPDGTDLEATDRVVRRIEAVLSAQENVDVFVAETGVAGGGSKLGGSQAAANAARITVDFLPDRNSAKDGDKIRIEDTRRTIDRVRAALAQIPGAELSVDKERTGPPVGKAIAVEVVGADFNEVGALAAQVRRQIRGLKGVTELSDNYRVGRPEMRLRIDRGAAKRVGASTVAVANTVRTAIAGTKASTLRDGKDEYDIVVQLDETTRDSLQEVLGLRIAGRLDTSPDNFPVPLSTVARYELAGGSGSIRHVDQELVVTIEGDVVQGFNENAVRKDVEKLIGEIATTEGYHLRMGGANTEQKKAQEFLGRAFLIALALVAAVLVTQFNSVTKPAIIMASVVLSLIGVLWGLLLTGTSFGVIMTGLGVISLAGVVVNNAIVLLDYVEQLRDRGVGVQEALVTAGLTRFRPVMLTAVTTVLGLLPMALGVSFDFFSFKVLIGGRSADFWGPMAVAVIFGLAFATVLTLVLVPTMYSILEDMRAFWARLRGVAPAAVTTGLALLLFGAVAPRPAAALTLEDAYAAAEQHNLSLAMTAQQTVVAEATRDQAWSLISPKLSAQSTYTINQREIAVDFTAAIPEELLELMEISADPIVIQEKTALAASVSVTQPLFNGQALPLLKAAYANLDGARSDEDAARTRIRSATAKAWYNLAIARERLRLSQTAAETAAAHLTLAERQVSAGSAPRRNLLSLARDRRPDLQAAEQRIRAARLQSTAQKLSWLPTLDGRFTLSYSENTGFSDEKTNWLIVFSANWTLWDGGARLGKTRESVAQTHMAELQRDQRLESVEQEIRTAWERLARSGKAMESVDHELKLAEENNRLADAAYAAGSATWLEVEDARSGLLAAQLSAIVERANRDLAAVDLAAAVGAL